MSSLAQLLADKIKADGLNRTQAAQKIGISMPSFRSILSGKSVPNKRSIGRYAKFLGIAVEEIAGLKKAGGKKGKVAKVKPAKVAKAKKGKPGRKPGRKPARAAAGNVGYALVQIAEALAAAEALLADELAMKVHHLDKRLRQKLSMFVS